MQRPAAVSHVGASSTQLTSVSHDGSHLCSIGKQALSPSQSELSLHSTHSPSTQTGWVSSQSEFCSHLIQARPSPQPNGHFLPSGVQSPPTLAVWSAWKSVVQFPNSRISNEILKNRLIRASNDANTIVPCSVSSGHVLGMPSSPHISRRVDLLLIFYSLKNEAE